ncbi:Myc-type basic helix-loop-helix (bHLH) domain [Arabidopsis thaliana x Arabidopsis arenosa]|uniref:Myc-type basic helix-loop-helix (BHLH) domain n=1 Tax=Arabidopsis thaliana x Arabidopsis arenosa TaxID=1240361 RepID=A0A8T2ABH5_9BRAS|nr:Myc-type basic helix-loop-helix (bHLH) domain [Arabidopsis thaliana x Arabidopsis arenosa]
MYPPNSSKSTAPDGGDAFSNQYDSAAGATRDFSSLAPQSHHSSPPQRQQHNPNLVGHYLSGEPSSIGFDSGASSSSLFRHRSSPAGFYDLPTDPNGFSLGQPNRGYSGGGGGERAPSRLKSELRFSGGSSSHQEHKSLPRISEAEAAAAAINGVASSSMSFGNNHNNNWDNSSSHISFTIDQPGKRSKNSDFFSLETQFSMPQTSLEMARMENLMNIPEDSVPCKARAKRGFATHPRSIAERERRTRISGKLKKLQELVPNMDKQTSYADMLDLAVEHIKGLQHQVESLEKGMEKCTCGACKKR